jgi:hypothetical protein
VEIGREAELGWRSVGQKRMNAVSCRLINDFRFIKKRSAGRLPTELLLIIKLELPDQIPFRDLSTGHNFDMRRLSELS